LENASQLWERISDPIIMIPTINDPRLMEPICTTLLPVETLHHNEWFSVRNRGGYYTIEHDHPPVMILPIVDNKSIVMVRVYRPIIDDITLEIPAGGAQENETPVEAAMREFREETGITVNDMNRFEMLPPLVHTPRSPCLPYYFQVHLTRDEFNSRAAHDNEIHSVECFEFKDILKKIVNGEIYIGLQIAMMTRYLLQNAIELFSMRNKTTVWNDMPKEKIKGER
jgi:8-oxo-dGTP pyrophosphatase MutT (NUDIX family)